ncbi:MAG: PocR ligand-binding domain-containing protein [Prolixibacteraceae bacterium]
MEKNKEFPIRFPELKDEIGLSDILNIDEFQRLQDLFAEAHGVASLITDPNGIPITKPGNFTRLCRDFILKSERAYVNCMKSDTIIGRQNHTGPVIQQCMCEGLRDLGASITVGGMQIANWTIGQVRNDEFDQEKVLKFAGEIGSGRGEFMEAYQEVPVMLAGQFKKITNVHFAFAKELSEKAYANLQLQNQIAEREKSTYLLQESETRFQMLFNHAPLSYNAVKFTQEEVR